MTPPAHIQGRIEAIVVRGAPRERARRVEPTTGWAGAARPSCRRAS